MPYPAITLAVGTLGVLICCVIDLATGPGDPRYRRYLDPPFWFFGSMFFASALYFMGILLYVMIVES